MQNPGITLSAGSMCRGGVKLLLMRRGIGLDNFGGIFMKMRWTPAGKRKIGRPKLTWRRSVEKEMREVGWTWSQVQRWATDRQHFSSLVTAICAT